MALKLLNLPDFCDNYKFKLIEELIYSDPLDYHYGKCKVIGKLAFENDAYYLKNIQIKCTDENYQIPTGTESILLLPSAPPKNFVNGAFAEVHGEAVFWRRNLNWNQHENQIPKTTRGLMIELRKKHIIFIDGSQMIIDRKIVEEGDYLFNENNFEESKHKFKSEWMPAIQLYTMNIINDAEDLIECNLRMRLLLKKHRQINQY